MFRPLPLFWPGAVSPAKVYSGCPSKVAWVAPSARLMVPKVPVTPAAVVGPVTGGQFCAQVPLQWDVVGVSGAKEYSVNPAALVSTVTPPIVAVFRLPAVAAAGLLLLVLPLPPLPLVEDVAGELHAARTAAAAATASSASSSRRRFGVCGRVSDLIIAFSFAPGLARAPCAGGALTIPLCNRRCRGGGLLASAPAPGQPPSQPQPRAACYPEAGRPPMAISGRSWRITRAASSPSVVCVG